MMVLKTITKIFAAGDAETTALDGVSLEVCTGEYLSVMGPSGCGKTTLLSLLGLLDRPERGEYWLAGKNTSELDTRGLVDLRRTLGFVFQNFNLIDELTVAENIALPLRYWGLSKNERRERIGEIVERLGISHRVNHRPSQLSGGQQQRVAIARALVVRPTVLLADEPTGNLDTAHGGEVMQMLEDANRSGTTLIVVTHSLSNATRAPRVIQLLDGRIVADQSGAAHADAR